MTEVAASATTKPDYGIDAPVFQRAAVIGGLLGVVVGRMMIDRGQLQSVEWPVQLGPAFISSGLSFFLVGCIRFGAANSASCIYGTKFSTRSTGVGTNKSWTLAAATD